jgi:CO dehydrogenase/acetyl-CoA synthase gamma subunit (corrinoid Fe-S protein)
VCFFNIFKHKITFYEKLSIFYVKVVDEFLDQHLSKCKRKIVSKYISEKTGQPYTRRNLQPLHEKSE